MSEMAQMTMMLQGASESFKQMDGRSFVRGGNSTEVEEEHLRLG